MNTEISRPRMIFTRPDPFPTAWASRYGEDEYGFFQEMNILTVPYVFRWINKGSFTMGSPMNERRREPDYEKQFHKFMSHGFWLGEACVNQGLYEMVMKENPSHFRDSDQLPVENITACNVYTFIKKVNTLFKIEKLIDIPTEREWEYACRAGTETTFQFGHDVTPEQANFNGRFPYHTAYDEHGFNRGKTLEVKSFKPNPWGLYNMHGNVREMCKATYPEDFVYVPYNRSTREKSRPDLSPVMLRGGAWCDTAGLLRCAVRSRMYNNLPSNKVGFRIVVRDAFYLAEEYKSFPTI